MRRDQRGFTLLEVLVAFIIAALALGVLYKGAIDGLLQARVATQYQQAIARARSRLASIGHGNPIEPGEQSGEDGDGFHWHTRVVTAATSAAKPDPGTMVPSLFAVSVAVSWGGGAAPRSVELDTKFVGFSPAGGP